MKVFEQNIINLYFDVGKQWLADLPKLIVQVEATYELLDLKPVENLSYNYVLSGFQGSKAIILKLGLDIDGFKREAAALMALQGFGVVQVLAESNGLLLQMRASPGVSLKSYSPENDDEAINVMANVIKRLHKAPIPHAHTFPHIKDWLAALDKDWSIPAQYLQKAKRLRDNLLKTSAKEILLHGDLHHDNILKNGDDWVVIDPKGVIGEKAYEVAAFIRNPMPELLEQDKHLSIIKHRITRFVEFFELSERRIIDWCFVQAVLTWMWGIEDRCNIDYWERMTKILDKL
ncbi:aminoglycoside phosphotransferase family protein [Candidatus Trichorickettsia mobilis]|uniref:aminoglycoside phosphotransferase family protein n=1 Tax=Candidatus Trichorickettsia mobilis TaxID=1346319 RepID=UPI00292CE07F|nr:aminoglycoside phosphotransferase family protein [Candidatus Trichorickettsia mobilis]